jgi:enoyl-CoA hydratase/carnithine racemase
MNDVVTEHSGSILRVELNRPAKLNAMTSAMYLALADIFTEAAKDEQIQVVLWHGAGASFCAGNDLEDFLKNPPGPGESPQARLMNALIDFDKPLIAAVQGAAIGGGTTMLLHCDFVYAGESAKIPDAFHQSGRRAGVRLKLCPSRKDRAPPRGRTDPAGIACRCQARRGVGTCDPGSPRSIVVGDGD